jgi:bifunctional non-homologous end joining protein LigD
MRYSKDRRIIEISHPDRILFPEISFTKADLADYYDRISTWLLPHIKDRALTLERYPGGIYTDGFMQQQAADSFPAIVKRTALKKKSGGTICHVVCTSRSCLQFLANQGCITLHRWLSRLHSPKKPDRLVFDLDPSSAADFSQVRTASLKLRDFLAELGLSSYVMTTGSSGLHVIVPVLRDYQTEAVYRFAQEVASILTQRYKQSLTSEQRRSKRQGRLYLDTSRNNYGQTAVAPYSIRAHASAPVATPLNWTELDRPGLHSKSYCAANIFRRLAQKDDPWKAIGKRAQSLRKPMQILKTLTADSSDSNA